jgi:hypothetical protein
MHRGAPAWQAAARFYWKGWNFVSCKPGVLHARFQLGVSNRGEVFLVLRDPHAPAWVRVEQFGIVGKSMILIPYECLDCVPPGSSATVHLRQVWGAADARFDVD